LRVVPHPRRERRHEQVDVDRALQDDPGSREVVVVTLWRKVVGPRTVELSTFGRCHSAARWARRGSARRACGGNDSKTCEGRVARRGTPPTVRLVDRLTQGLTHRIAQPRTAGSAGGRRIRAGG